MKITHTRNATLIVEYGGKTFLIDPMLAEKGTYPPFPNSIRQDQNNPLVNLPISVEEIIADVDAVIVTHLHLDHFDDAAKQALPKDIKMFVQNEEDAAVVKEAGFKNVEVLTQNTVFEGVELIKTKGEHGRGEILKRTGLGWGFFLKKKNKKTFFVAGDTVGFSAFKKKF